MSPTLRILLVPVFAFVVFLTHSAAQSRPNILFICADDLRMNLGCYGDEIAVTPHLDRLAKESRVFERAYVQIPSCNASRSSLITGMRPDSISVWRLNDHFRETAPDVITMPEHFKNHGYHTESIGKVLHNYNKIRDNDRSWSVPARMDQVNHFDDYAQKDMGWSGPNRGPAAENVVAKDSDYADGLITDDAVSTIQLLAKSEKPFFLAVGFLKPHSPYNAPRRYWDLYRREDMNSLGPESKPLGVPELNWFHFREIRNFPDVPDAGPIPDATARTLRHGYYAATSYLDANVGRLLDALEENDLMDNTLIVFWSDHGYHLGESSHWTKVSARDLDARIPLLVRVPGMDAGSTEAIVESTDLFPTLAELCGLPALSGLDGVSFKNTLEDPAQPARETALTQTCRPWPSNGEIEQMGYSLRSERWRYIRWIDHRTKKLLAEELYDHDNDPLERRNLSDEPRVEKDLDRMRSLLAATRMVNGK